MSVDSEIAAAKAANTKQASAYQIKHALEALKKALAAGWEDHRLRATFVLNGDAVEKPLTFSTTQGKIPLRLFQVDHVPEAETLFSAEKEE